MTISPRCPDCGKRVGRKSRYCPECGTRIESPSESLLGLEGEPGDENETLLGMVANILGVLKQIDAAIDLWDEGCEKEKGWWGSLMRSGAGKKNEAGRMLLNCFAEADQSFTTIALNTPYKEVENLASALRTLMRRGSDASRILASYVVRIAAYDEEVDAAASVIDDINFELKRLIS